MPAAFVMLRTLHHTLYTTVSPKGWQQKRTFSLFQHLFTLSNHGVGLPSYNHSHFKSSLGNVYRVSKKDKISM
jgi:hypothetical protein